MAVPNVNILQWNARNIKTNQNALSQFLHENPTFSILAISETHLQPNESLQFPNYSAYRADRIHQKGGGAALLIHTDLPSEQIHFHSPLEAVAVRVMVNGLKTTVMSVYLPPNLNVNKEFEDLISQIPHPAIICGDLNALMQNHGSAYSNQRGRFIQRLAAIKNFTILNSNKSTLQQRPNTNPTAPDITLISDHFIDYFDWQVSDVTLGSDHYVIQITAPAPPHPPANGSTTTP
jgi:exonuclease III